jgi:hypothetical protein
VWSSACDMHTPFARKECHTLLIQLTTMQPRDWQGWVIEQTGARELLDSSVVQSLWGGCGELLRLRLRGGARETVILKRVVPLGSSYGDRRKRRSYEVEQQFYGTFSARCHDGCRVAGCLGRLQQGGSALLLLEDLAEAGYSPQRSIGVQHIRTGLSWLANFHAQFLNDPGAGLWDQGGYWHLQTRPEEWERMPAGALKELAPALDRCLRSAKFFTLMHGDSKPANFLWSSQGAAAVDFQYVGRGCGIRDVAYFLDCCLHEEGCAAEAEQWLDFYFGVLRKGLGEAAAEVEAEWRALYPVAWADYCRFWVGWGRRASLGAYSGRQLERAVQHLEQAKWRS